MNDFVKKYKSEQLIKRQFRKGFGCKFDPPKKEDAVFGKFFKGTLPPKDWRPFLPVGEQQENSYFCTSFAYLNVLETMIRASGENFNFSDRWSAVRAKTAPNGNSIDNVCHAGLHEGNVKEEECPFKEEWLEDPQAHWNEIQDIENLNPSVIYPGPNYSTVGLKELKSALAYSPLVAGAYVGNTWGNEIVEKPSETFGGHAFEIAYIDDYIYIFDSYPPFVKKLSLDYPIIAAKSLATLPKDWKSRNLQDDISIMKKIINLMKILIDMINEKYASLTKNAVKTEDDPLITPTEAPQMPQVESKPLDRINDIALAIKSFEGWFQGSRSFRNLNPGNLRYSPYTKSLGAINKDKDNFCIFKSEEVGFNALCQLLKDAFNGLLIPYKKCKTLQDFFGVYAPGSDGNHPKNYAKFVSIKTGISVCEELKNLV